MNQVRHFLATTIVCATAFLAQPAPAQGLFSAAAYVNDGVITEFEVEQREMFLGLLNAPDANRAAVLEALIEERLRSQEVERAGLALTDEAVQAGLEEFAARVNLSAEEFTTVLEENGIAKETFEDFVRTGVAWRDYIRSRFGQRLEVTEKEIDQALGSVSGVSTIRVLVSEIIIPAAPDRLDEVKELAEQIAASDSQAEFAEFARRFSATESRDRGGNLPWQSLSNLPPVLRPLILALAPGEVTDPITIPDAVALFQLRGIEETGAPKAEFAAIDYAVYYIPGGRSPEALSQAEKIRAEVDRCDDLYAIARDQPPEILERGSKPPAEIPVDIALELSKLDPGETSVALTRNNGTALAFVMLCGRTAVANENVAREEVAASLRTSRLNAIAESFLEQLRADARIRIE